MTKKEKRKRKHVKSYFHAYEKIIFYNLSRGKVISTRPLFVWIKYLTIEKVTSLFYTMSSPNDIHSG